MQLFLWRQTHRKIESSVLLTWAVEEYEAMKQDQKTHRESQQDSLFEFFPEIPEFEIVKTSSGKPLVVDGDGEPLPIHISVTHTGDWWICAVGEHPVGIDVELKDRSVKPALMGRICSEEEHRWLEEQIATVGVEEKEEWLRQTLLWLWVRKEAYVKYLGTGIGEGLKTFSVVEFDGEGNWAEKEGFQAVDLVEELELVVYSPQEEVEEIRWRKW